MRARYVAPCRPSTKTSASPSLPGLLADAWWILAGIADGEVDHNAVRAWLRAAAELRRQLRQESGAS